MREPLLDDRLSPIIKPLEPSELRPFDRRRFLQTLGAAGLGLAFVFKGVPAVFAAPGGASTIDANAGAWRDCVTGFVETVFDFDRSRAQEINARLTRATLVYAPKPTDFHSYFSAPFIFQQVVEQHIVVCRNGFEVRWFPLYGRQLPCESCQDLNASEIRRITNQTEMGFYGCVVSPTGQRKDRYDHASYLRTIAKYPYDPDDFNVGYARDFRTVDKTVPGFYISHKTRTGPSGKPLGDMLLGDPEAA